MPGGWTLELALPLPGPVPFWQVPWALCLRAHGAQAQGSAVGLRALLGRPPALRGLTQVTLAVAPAQGSQGAPELALAMKPALPVSLEPAASAVVLEQGGHRERVTPGLIPHTLQ